MLRIGDFCPAHIQAAGRIAKDNYRAQRCLPLPWRNLRLCLTWPYSPPTDWVYQLFPGMN